MEKELFFHILGVEETKEEEEIRKAYLEKLKGTNPEDDPEGFKRLRQAYEGALAFAGNEENSSGQAVGPVDLWMEKVERLYRDLMDCQKPGLWEELFSDPVCEGLDTSLEARERLLDFLMENNCLPHKIWVLLDNVFWLLEDYEELSGEFPLNFLRLVRYYVENEDFMPYGFFRYRQAAGEEDRRGNRGEADKDAYIAAYLDVKQQTDRGGTEGLLQKLEDMQVYNVYHPYEDVERMRLLAQSGRAEESRIWMERLCRDYPGDTYIETQAGNLLWKLGEKKAAYEKWKSVLGEGTEHYGAKYGVVRYLVERQEYVSAREMIVDLLEWDPYSEELNRWLQMANEDMIQEMSGEPGAENAGFPVVNTCPEGLQEEEWREKNFRLGWCLFQNGHLEELEKFMAGMPEEWKGSPAYNHLYGRYLHYRERYEEAIPYLEKWLGWIGTAPEDGTGQRRHISQVCRANLSIGGCYAQLGRLGEADGYIRKAIRETNDENAKMEYRQYYASVLLRKEECEKAAEVCNEILREDDGYYPAYIIRQEAYYKLGRAQEVIDDYYRAVEIYAGFCQPYLFAAEVFLDYGQYEDAMGILKQAGENQVEFTAKMRLCEIRLLRGMAKNRGDRREIRKRLDKLQKELEEGAASDLEDKSELEFEQGMLWWEDGKRKEALACIERAIEQNPERPQYRLACGDLCWEMRKYEKALGKYKAAEADYAGSAGFYYRRGLHYGERGNVKSAIRDLEKVMELQDGYQDTCERLADYYYTLYQKEYRRRDYAKALQLISRQMGGKGEEKDKDFFMRRGLMYMEALEPETAIPDFEKAMEYAPEDWKIRNSLGCCYKYMGEYKRAMEYFEQALRRTDRKRESVPYSNMAECCEALGEYGNAIRYYKDAVKACRRKVLWSDDNAYIQAMRDKIEGFMNKIGDLSCYRGDYLRAFWDYSYYGIGANAERLWLALGLDRLCILGYKSKILFAGKEEKAMRQKKLGMLYLCDMAEYAKAAECFRKAASGEKEPMELSEYECCMAIAYYMMGRYEEAKRHGEAAFFHFYRSGQGTVADYLEYKPLMPERLGRIGWMLLCVGRMEDAKTHFRAIDKAGRCKFCTHRECYKGRLFMGYLYESHGKMEQAREEFRAALLLNPNSVQCRRALKRAEKKPG